MWHSLCGTMLGASQKQGLDEGRLFANTASFRWSPHASPNNCSLGLCNSVQGNRRQAQVVAEFGLVALTCVCCSHATLRAFFRDCVCFDLDHSVGGVSHTRHSDPDPLMQPCHVPPRFVTISASGRGNRLRLARFVRPQAARHPLHRGEHQEHTPLHRIVHIHRRDGVLLAPSGVQLQNRRGPIGYVRVRFPMCAVLTAACQQGQTQAETHRRGKVARTIVCVRFSGYVIVESVVNMSHISSLALFGDLALTIRHATCGKPHSMNQTVPSRLCINKNKLTKNTILGT